MFIIYTRKLIQTTLLTLCAGEINKHNRIIVTICEHIVAKDATVCADDTVCIEETSYCRIIIPTLQIVEPCFGIVVVSAVWTLFAFSTYLSSLVTES